MDRRRPNDDELSRIAELLRAGGTASSIGAEVGRSRGSIVGIVHRHLAHVGFSAGAPAMVKLVRKRRMLEKRRRQLREAAKVKPEDIEVVEDLGVTEPGWYTNHHPITPEMLAAIKAAKIRPIEPPPSDDGNIRLMDLRDVHCRWPLWDDGTPVESKFFCGAAVARGRYCAKHAERMFSIPRPRR